MFTGAAQPHPAARYAGLLAVAVYGGYFNGGLGILLMAFAWAGAIVWPQAVVMMAGATAGGLAGERLARRLLQAQGLHGGMRPPTPPF